MKASSSLLFIAIISTFSLLAFSTSIFPLVLEERHISESVIQETKEIQANAQPLQGNKIVLADSLSPCITLSQDSFFCDSEKWTYEFEFSNTSTEDLQQLIVGAFSLLDTVLARDTLFFDPPIEVNDTSDRQQFFIPDSLFLDSVKILLTAYANDSTFCILDTLNFNTSEVCNDSTTCEYFIPCPKDTTIFLEEAFSSTVVTFPTSEDTCGNTIISYSPPSGSIFPCGITTVTRTADDTLNQTSNSCFFDVIVDCIADSICPIPTENLLAFFPLDNQPFDASDSTDNVLFPSRLPSYTTDRNGNINSSALFDRDQAQSIDVQTTSLLDELDEMTLSLWFRVDDLPLEGNNNAMTIISKRDTLEGVPEDVFGLYVFQNEAPNGTLSLISIVNGDLQAANPVYLGGVGRGEALELGEWYCATLKVKNTNPFVELYLDGTLIDQSNRDPGVIRTANQILSIGRKDNTPRPEYFSGAIDEVKIYDRPVAVDSLCCAIIEPPLPPCCEAEIFEQQFNRGFQSIIDSCGIRVRALSLDTCYQVTYDFGDDSDSTRVLGNTSVQHQYAEAGNYTICASVETFDVKDRICQQSDTCWTLCVDCSSCDDPKLINLSVDRFGGSGEELAKAMQLDGDGNIYLTGVFENSLNIGGKILNSEGGKDIFVAKFDPNRRSLWAFSIGGEADDFVNDISIDLSNNVFLAGHFESDLLEFPISSSRPTISGTEAHNTDFPNTTDAFFAKYRPVLNGDIAYDWSYAIGDSGNDRVEAIAVNKEGEIFVGGAYGGNADFDPNSTTSIAAFQTEDAFLAKYYEENGALKFRWQRHWGGEVSSDTVSLSEVKAIEIDEQGAIYLTGAFSGQEAAFDYANTSTDCVGNGENGACTLSAKSEVSNTFITQFQRDGNCNWSYLLEAEGGSKGYALTVDEAYLYTTGIISTASSSTNFDFIDSDGFASFSCNGAACTYVVKYQRENLTYESAFLLETGDSETGLDIEADGRKNIWLSGSFAKERVDFDVRSGPVIQSSGGQDMFIANYDQAGNYINAINPGGSGDDASKAIELASNGDLIFFGNYTSSDLDPIASIDESYFPFNRGSSDLLFARYRSLCPVEVSCPDDVRMLAPLGEDSLIVNFAAPFSSNFCNDNSITASHQSGDLFPCGTTLVTYTSINPIFRDTATCSFNVSVACASQCLSDISCPSDTIILTNQSEITVNYPLPIDTDTCSNLQFTYDLPSGSLFSCDTTSVRFTAVDTLLLDTIICDFDVILECDTLTDCTPNFTCPSDTIIVLEALSSEIEVHYPLPIDSNACENIQFTYDPPSGSLFSCGSTTVAGTAIDTILLDTTFCSFQVLVECDTLPQPSACCQDSLNLNRVAENVFSQRRLNCDTLCFFPVMDSCNLLGEIDWGDGDVDAWNADVDMLNAICHKYEIEASSDFLVCITIAVQEEDSICRQARICETIRVESCEEAVLCECGAWNDFDVNFDSAMASQHACGEAVDVPNCDFEWNISGGFDCLPDTCSASYTWDLRKRGGDVVLSGNGSGNTFDIPIDVSSEGAGIYDFVITSNCGDSACEGCDLTFNVGCEETCACGTFSDIRFGASAENAFALSCNSDPILLECPDEMDEFYQLTGLTACDSDCRMSNLEWSLVSDGEVLLSGNENNTLRGFNFDIPTAAFSASGNYSLFIGGTCGEDACRCRLRFIVPEDCEAESCTCGQFNSLQLVESNGNVLDLECNNSTAYELSCPTRNRAIYFDYACADADCVAAEILTWELTHISSNSIIIGSINLDANADLHLLPLSDSLFEQLGDYRLTLLTNCGEANCTCELLLNNACEENCACEDLESDWLAEEEIASLWSSESGTPDWNTWINDCQLYFSPNQMKACDQISWRLIEEGNSDNVQRQISIGNERVVFEVAQDTRYELQVTITRLSEDGGLCTFTYSANRNIFCDSPTAFACSDIYLQNGSFAQDLSAWTTLFNAPTIIEEAGSDGNAYLRFSGSSNYREIIMQDLDLSTESIEFFLLSLDFKIDQLLPESEIVLRSTNTSSNQIIEYGRLNIPDQMPLNQWLNSNTFVLPAQIENIAISVESAYPDAGTAATRTQIGIDNIQILPILTQFPTRNPIVYLDEMGQAELTASEVLTEGIFPCIFPDLRLSQNRFTCADIGVNELELMTSTSNLRTPFSLTVIDTIAPSISCPADINVIQCTSNVPINFASPLVLDNCQNGLTLRLVEGLESGSVFPIGRTEQLYEVKDRSDNVATCAFHINIGVFDTEIEAQSPSCTNFEDGSAKVSITGGSGMAFYTWSNGANTATISNLAAGEYRVTVIDGNGCRVTDSVEIAAPPLFFFDSIIVNSPENAAAQGNISAMLAGGIAPYMISLMQDSFIITSDTNYFENLEIGTYRIVATDAIGCTIVSEPIIIDLSTSLENWDLESRLQVYPNPSSGQFNVEMQLPEIESYQIDLFDIRGQKVKTLLQDRSQALKASFELSDYAAGIYFIKVQVADRLVVRRLILADN